MAVIGSDRSPDELFLGRAIPSGSVIRIGDFRMRVIGVMAERGIQLWASIFDDAW